jgi:D-glycero-D-manno-heptose 1,7-bisphosphate phosphatase
MLSYSAGRILLPLISMHTPLAPALFIDRDGVINRDEGYTFRVGDFQLLPGVVEILRQFSDAGFSIVVITNQAGIARGYYSEAEFQQITAHMTGVLLCHGIQVAGVYHCPHHPDGTVPELAIACDCRKPAPGMILRAAAEHHLDLRASWIIGDKQSDIDAGLRAGLSIERCLRVECNAGLLALSASIGKFLKAHPPAIRAECSGRSD